MRTYTISELAREFGVTPRALRFYEDKDLLHPKRDGMNRVYSHRDRGRLQLILQGKRVGFSLGEIREILDVYTLEGHRAQLVLTETKFRAQKDKLVRQREDIDGAMTSLEDGLSWVQGQLRDMAAQDDDTQSSVRAFDAVARQSLGAEFAK